MRGGLLHNQVLLRPIEDLVVCRGATVRREAPTRPGRQAGFVDLFITYRSFRIACEAELTSARVNNDLQKAVALCADMLLIVVPTARVARAARAKLRRADCKYEGKGLTVLVKTLGQAIQQLNRTFGQR